MRKAIETVLKKLREDSIYLNTLIITVGTVLGNLFAFLVQIILPTYIPQQKFSNLYFFLNIIYIFSPLGNALRMYISRESTILINKQDYEGAISLTDTMFFITSLASFSFFLLINLGLKHYINFFHLETTDIPAFFITEFTIILIFGTMIYTGLGQSLQNPWILSISQMLPPFVRLLLTLVIVLLSQNITYQIVGLIPLTLNWYTGLLIFMLWISIKEVQWEKQKNIKVKEDVRIRLKEISTLIPVTLMNVIYTLLTYIDVPVVQHIFEDEVTRSQYALSALISKSSQFLIGGLSLVVLPRFVSHYVGNNTIKLKDSFIKTVIFSSFLFVIYWLAIAIIGVPFLFPLLYGKKYSLAYSLSLLFCLSFFPYGLTNVLMNFYVATKRWLIFSLITFIGLALFLVGSSLFHTSLWDILILYGITGFFIIISIILDTYLYFKKNEAKR